MHTMQTNGKALGQSPEPPTARATAHAALKAIDAAQKRQFQARKQGYQALVADWRDKGRLLTLQGMGCKAPPAEFERACRERFSQGQRARFEWEPAKKLTRMHQGRVALGFDTVAERKQAERDLARWVWKIHPIILENVAKKRRQKDPLSEQTKKQKGANVPNSSSTSHGARQESATSVSPRTIAHAISTPHQGSSTDQTLLLGSNANSLPVTPTPHTIEIIDLTGDSSPAACPPGNDLTAPINVPCAAAASVSEAVSIAAEAAAYADGALAEAQAATFRAFEAEAAGHADAAAAAKQDAAKADERARAAYGAAATAARIASAYSAVIGLRGSCCRY